MKDGKARWKESGEDRLPPLPDADYLLTWLFELDPTRSNGFGLVGVTWTELHSWSILSGHMITSNEAIILHRLSGLYAGMTSSAHEKDCEPPYQPDVEVQRKSASDQLKAILDAMIESRKKK